MEGRSMIPPFVEVRAAIDAVATAAERTADMCREDLNHDAEANWAAFAVFLREISAGYATVKATPLSEKFHEIV